MPFPSEFVEVVNFSEFEKIAGEMKEWAAKHPMTFQNAMRPQPESSRRIYYMGQVFTIVYTESPDDYKERHFSISGNTPRNLAEKLADLFLPGERMEHKGMFMPVIHFRQKMACECDGQHASLRN